MPPVPQLSPRAGVVGTGARGPESPGPGEAGTGTTVTGLEAPESGRVDPFLPLVSIVTTAPGTTPGTIAPEELYPAVKRHAAGGQQVAVERRPTAKQHITAGRDVAIEQLPSGEQAPATATVDHMAAGPATAGGASGSTGVSGSSASGKAQSGGGSWDRSPAGAPRGSVPGAPGTGAASTQVTQTVPDGHALQAAPARRDAQAPQDAQPPQGAQASQGARPPHQVERPDLTLTGIISSHSATHGDIVYGIVRFMGESSIVRPHTMFQDLAIESIGDRKIVVEKDGEKFTFRLGGEEK